MLLVRVNQFFGSGYDVETGLGQRDDLAGDRRHARGYGMERHMRSACLTRVLQRQLELRPHRNRRGTVTEEVGQRLAGPRGIDVDGTDGLEPVPRRSEPGNGSADLPEPDVDRSYYLGIGLHTSSNAAPARG